MSGIIAFFGDVHGAHDKMCDAIRKWNFDNKKKIALAVCAGDFEPVRNETDMKSVAVSQKNFKMGDFHAYAKGEKEFPCRVIFIGGNNEPYNFLDQMPDGGKVAENCYYLGRVGVTEEFGLRLGYLTGIFAPKTYEPGRPDIDWDDPEIHTRLKVKKKAGYFTKEEMRELMHDDPIDILLLHDWPTGLAAKADKDSTEGKPRFTVGNKPARYLMEIKKPRWLFCGHIHHYYHGRITWNENKTTTFTCLDRIPKADGPFMAVLEKDSEGNWQIQIVR